MTTKHLTQTARAPQPVFAPEGAARNAEPGVLRLLREIGESTLFVPYQPKK